MHYTINITQLTDMVNFVAVSYIGIVSVTFLLNLFNYTHILIIWCMPSGVLKSLKFNVPQNHPTYLFPTILKRKGDIMAQCWVM
jgi:hypothetical protein